MKYMKMRSPQEALDVIAGLIREEATIEEQDMWLNAAIDLGYVDL